VTAAQMQHPHAAHRSRSPQPRAATEAADRGDVPRRRRIVVRRWTPNDDLLAGLDRAERPHELRAFLATTIAVSLPVWDLAFTLGAYHTVFYSRLFQILVVSSVLLLGSIVLRNVITVSPWMRALLAIPLLWLVVRLIAPLGRSGQAGHVLDLVLIGLTLVTVPFTLWVVARILAPEYFALPGRRLKVAALTIVVFVGLIAFLVGQFNFEFTTCHDYDISGDNTPTNCRTTRPGPAHSFTVIPAVPMTTR
jgi:hypothetical protein